MVIFSRTKKYNTFINIQHRKAKAMTVCNTRRKNARLRIEITENKLWFMFNLGKKYFGS